MTLNSEIFRDFQLIYSEILKISQAESPYKFRLIGSYLLTFLIRLKEQRWQQYDPVQEGSRSSVLVKRFKELLEVHYVSNEEKEGTLPTLQMIAEAMHLHPSYLSQIIRHKTNKTVTEWINQAILRQAKSLLSRHELNFKEISHRLGYSEATHFGRFFKQQTKLSPGHYRQKIKNIT